MATLPGVQAAHPSSLVSQPTESTSSPTSMNPTNSHTCQSPLEDVPSDLADASPFPTVLRRTSTGTGSIIGLHQVNSRARDTKPATKSPSSEPSKKTKASRDWYGFEPHYGLLQGSVRLVLQEVLEDVAINRSIHTWDQKLFVSPMKQLQKVVRQHMSEHPNVDMSALLLGVVVETVTTANGSTTRRSPLQNDVPGTLFFGKVADGTRAERTSQDVSKHTGNPHTIPYADGTHYGRIILVKDHLPSEERVALLLLLSLCIRLQNEDYAYIQAFMERHLVLKNDLSWPSQFQRKSHSQLSSSDQLIYKRITLSSHLNYLKPAVSTETKISTSDADQEQLFSSRGRFGEHTCHGNIVKTMTSVLLTIALPETSSTNQEELDLLNLPQGSWTVMVVNCHERLSRDMEREPTQYLTPLAQFLRGLTYSLRTQNMNAETIYDQLKAQLRDADDGELFDDEGFTKSSLYHWTVKTCDELRESLLASQRYLARAFDRKLTTLFGNDAHESEQSGLGYWRAEHEAEVHALEELVLQIVALSSSVQESRNALHGVTAVLEARVALKQGERIKVLAYLATIYLPLTATSSLYSMSVLPTSATFWSFFVVLIAFLLCTALLALSLKPLASRIRAKFTIDVRGTKKTTKMPRWIRFMGRCVRHVYQNTGLEWYVEYYIDIINPTRGEGVFLWSDVFGPGPVFDGWFDVLVYVLFKVPYLLLRDWPKALVREALTREVLFLRDQYYLYYSLKKNIPNLHWSPLALFRDGFRLLFVPVWCGVIVAIIALLVAEDILLVPFLLIAGVVTCIVNLFK